LKDAADKTDLTWYSSLPTSIDLTGARHGRIVLKWKTGPGKISVGEPLHSFRKSGVGSVLEVSDRASTDFDTCLRRVRRRIN
jgi:hypothetical protein